VIENTLMIIGVQCYPLALVSLSLIKSSRSDSASSTSWDSLSPNSISIIHRSKIPYMSSRKSGCSFSAVLQRSISVSIIMSFITCVYKFGLSVNNPNLLNKLGICTYSFVLIYELLKCFLILHRPMTYVREVSLVKVSVRVLTWDGVYVGRSAIAIIPYSHTRYGGLAFITQSSSGVKVTDSRYLQFNLVHRHLYLVPSKVTHSVIRFPIIQHIPYNSECVLHILDVPLIVGSVSPKEPTCCG